MLQLCYMYVTYYLWSRINAPTQTVLYHLWSHIIGPHRPYVHVNQYICKVVNSNISWSVYLYMYTNVHPPHGPCPPPPQRAIVRIMQGHDVCWKQICHHIPPTYRRYTSNQALTCLRQLLCNQLPPFMVIETGRFSHRRCVVNAEYKYYTPHQRWSCHILTSRA